MNVLSILMLATALANRPPAVSPVRSVDEWSALQHDVQQATEALLAVAPFAMPVSALTGAARAPAAALRRVCTRLTVDERASGTVTLRASVELLPQSTAALCAYGAVVYAHVSGDGEMLSEAASLAHEARSTVPFEPLGAAVEALAACTYVAEVPSGPKIAAMNAACVRAVEAFSSELPTLVQIEPAVIAPAYVQLVAILAGIGAGLDAAGDERLADAMVVLSTPATVETITTTGLVKASELMDFVRSELAEPLGLDPASPRTGLRVRQGLSAAARLENGDIGAQEEATSAFSAAVATATTPLVRSVVLGYMASLAEKWCRKTANTADDAAACAVKELKTRADALCEARTAGNIDRIKTAAAEENAAFRRLNRAAIDGEISREPSAMRVIADGLTVPACGSTALVQLYGFIARASVDRQGAEALLGPLMTTLSGRLDDPADLCQGQEKGIDALEKSLRQFGRQQDLESLSTLRERCLRFQATTTVGAKAN